MIPGTRSPPASQTRCWGDSGLDVILTLLGTTWPGLRVQGTSVSPGGASPPGSQEAPIPYEAPSVPPDPAPRQLIAHPHPAPNTRVGPCLLKIDWGRSGNPQPHPQNPHATPLSRALTSSSQGPLPGEARDLVLGCASPWRRADGGGAGRAQGPGGRSAGWGCSPGRALVTETVTNGQTDFPSSSLYSERLHSEEPRLLRKETGQEVIQLLGRGWGLGTPEACSRPRMVRGQAAQGLLAPGGDGAFV